MTKYPPCPECRTEMKPREDKYDCPKCGRWYYQESWVNRGFPLVRKEKL